MEATEAFFAMTRLFQSNDVSLFILFFSAGKTPFILFPGGASNGLNWERLLAIFNIT